MFEFDRELFISKVYEKALRGSLKDTVKMIRRERGQPYVVVTPEERNRNEIIEHELEYTRELRREIEVLLFGDQDCAQTFINSMKIAHTDGFTHEEREKYQKVVTNIIIRVMESMYCILKNGNVELEDTAKMHAKVLSQEMEKIQNCNWKITMEAAGAVRGLWEDKQFVEKLLCDERITDSSL